MRRSKSHAQQGKADADGHWPFRTREAPPAVDVGLYEVEEQTRYWSQDETDPSQCSLGCQAAPWRPKEARPKT